MLAFENFSKTYPGGKRAVDRLSLSVDAGDIYGFIGHNGAGKTTAIRAAVGALGFEEGEIRIGGMSVREEPVACKAITAYIPDNPELYDYLTGMQYINFIADVFGVAEAERQQRIARYAAAFEMEESLGGLIGSYSHGMKQKTALIAALVHAPKLLILDEPFVGLDPKASHTLKGMMRELCDARQFSSLRMCWRWRKSSAIKLRSSKTAALWQRVKREPSRAIIPLRMCLWS